MDNSNADLVYNMSQLLKERVGSTRKLTLQTPELILDAVEGTQGERNAEGGDALVARDLHGGAKATRLGDGLLIQGDIEAGVQLECSRCLDQFTATVDASLEEQYKQTVEVETGRLIERSEFEESDSIFDIDHNHLMDLSEPVRQALLVALPMKPLCREDCAGICPECGANRNEADCGHTPQTLDNRWAGLLELRLGDIQYGDNAN
ncbi:MAG: DUF177 domain-containing protein [Chloroflexota bacterium]|nr:DUF177 domain-containing protein [Chloroflexota bacterium]